jgi:ABC-type glycerol-3-phosphate transport system permease component
MEFEMPCVAALRVHFPLLVPAAAAAVLSAVFYVWSLFLGPVPKLKH